MGSATIFDRHLVSSSRSRRLVASVPSAVSCQLSSSSIATVIMRAYKVVDAFSSRPFKGNPVAVVLDAEGLSTEEMQAIARWTNLSETTFLLPPTDPSAADYHLRIFTSLSELPFAGHPTLGSAHAALESGRVQPRNGYLVQECGRGLVKIAVEGDDPTTRRLVLELPQANITPLEGDHIEELESILGSRVLRDPAPTIIDVGAIWVVAQLETVDGLLAVDVDFARCAAFERRLGVTGVTLFATYPENASDTGPDIEVRSFSPSTGGNEDPVCGSGNGSVAVFRHHHGLLRPEGQSYTASQGQKVGRSGRIDLNVDVRGNVTVGGNCVTCVDGTLRVE